MFADPHFSGHGFESGASWLTWLFPLLVIALLITIVVLLVISMRNTPEPTAPAVGPAPGAPIGGDPVQRAALRLAAGEITLSEFDEIRSRVAEPTEGDQSEDDGSG